MDKSDVKILSPSASYTVSTNIPGVSGVFNSVLFTERIQRNWSVTPGYFGKRRSHPHHSGDHGELPVNPFSYYSSKRGEPLSSYKYETYYPDGRLGVRYLVSGYFRPYNFTQHPALDEGLVSPSVIAAMRERCDLRILEKIKDCQVNLAQVVAERNQTFGLITNVLGKLSQLVRIVNESKKLRLSQIKQLRKLLSDADRRRAGGPSKGAIKRQIKSLSDDAIAIQYGVRPLLSDLDALFKLYDKGKTFRKSVVYTTSAKNSRTLTYTVYGVHYTVTTTDEVSIKMGVRFSATSNSLSFMSSLGLTNPLAIGWELTPWSFVIDWFIPIGSTLGVLDATLGLSFTSGYETIKRTTTTVTSASYDAGNPFPLPQESFTARSVDVESVTSRRRLSSFPLIHIPSFKSPLSFEHCFNALALLGQRLRR